jgi:hypothetical protein
MECGQDSSAEEKVENVVERGRQKTLGEQSA